MRISPVALVASLVLLNACGGDTATPSGNNNNTSGPMSATVNGTAWTANSASAVATSNLIVITGLRLTAPNYTMSITLYNVGSTGVYPLGMNVTMFGGTVVVSSPTLGGWNTPLTGAAGEINITTLSSTRIAGTFSFTATPQSPTTGNLTVTNGAFDMPLSGTVPVIAANAGNKLSATIGGLPFNAGTATSSVTSGTNGSVAILGNNIDRSLGITLSGVTATGTYALSATPARTISVSGVAGNPLPTWASQLTGGSGTVTITTFSASRIIGTFSATLVPLGSGATGNLTVTGSFDMGRLF